MQMLASADGHDSVYSPLLVGGRHALHVALTPGPFPDNGRGAGGEGARSINNDQPSRQPLTCLDPDRHLRWRQPMPEEQRMRAGAVPSAETHALDLIDVPSGAFVMGDDGGRPDERPARTVWVDAFAVARTPVTNAEF